MFDWIGSVLDWFLDVIAQIFIALWELLCDLGVLLLETILSLFLALLSFLTLPDFLAAGLGSYLDVIDPSVMYFLDRSGITVAFSFLGTGVMFRLTRKLLTLGQW